MTNELEKQFFDTFRIEPKADIWWCENDNKICDCNYDCDEICRRHKTGYPQITDRILLELICILNSVSVEFKSECMEDLKQEILGEAIILLKYAPSEKTAEFIKHQVRKLFEEG